MYISRIENEEQIENKNKYKTNWNKEQLENKQRIKNGYRTNQLSIRFFLFDINLRSGYRLHPHLVKYKFFTLNSYANNRTNDEVRYIFFFFRRVPILFEPLLII